MPSVGIAPALFLLPEAQHSIFVLGAWQWSPQLCSARLASTCHIMLSTPSLSWARGSGVLSIALLAWLHFALSIYSVGHLCSSTLCASLHVVVEPTSQASGLHLCAVRLVVEFSTFALLAWLQLAASSHSRADLCPGPGALALLCASSCVAGISQAWPRTASRVLPIWRRRCLSVHSCFEGC